MPSPATSDHGAFDGSPVAKASSMGAAATAALVAGIEKIKAALVAAKLATEFGLERCF